MTAAPDDTTTDLHAVIAELRSERDAGLAREEELRAAQAAGLEVLQAMAASPGDTQPVFDLIARRAADLCTVPAAAVAMFDGTMLHLATQDGFDPAFASVYATQFPRPVGSDTVIGRTILSRRVEQIEDFDADPAYGMARAPGHWSAMAVPLLRSGVPLGVIAVARPAIGRFPDNQVTLLQTFAEQAVIAVTSSETHHELQARTVVLAQRNSEYSERIEQQAATIDVLKAMSASPGDAQPVFDLIVRRARDLCNAPTVGLLEFDGELVHLRSIVGMETYGRSAAFDAYSRMFPMVPTRGSINGRAILDARSVHVRDLDAEPGLMAAVRSLGHKSQIAWPLLRDGAAIGAVSLGSAEIGGFSDSQVGLLETFAEQAVIAITSAETYRALQTRTSDLQRSLEYQTATSDVLKVISRSTFDLQPVLDAVVETAARLCDADQAVIARREGELMRLVANHGFPPEYEALVRAQGAYPIDRAPRNAGPRAIREGRIVHVHDAAAEPGYTEAAITLGKQRTSLGVPLLREGEVMGAILLARQRVEPFTDRQIELVSTFADQAVIAIENTRLLTEQREALEQQTATAEVLQVINANPGDLGPVFDMILEKAHRLCDIGMGALLTCDAGQHRAVVTRGYSPEADAHARRLRPILDNLAALAKSGAVLHHPDVSRADSPLSDDFGRTFIALTGARTYLVVPLSKEGTLLGTITAVRSEVRPFTERQITLLRNFAAQAVIAMENARLINEQREALEQQTATAEVLRVINASPGNLAPVFDAMLEKAHRLCGAAIGSLTLYDGTVCRTVATRGYPEQYSALLREPFPPGVGQQALIRGDRLFHVPDMQAVAPPPGVEARLRLFTELGLRTGLSVPLRKDGVLLGMISAARLEVRPFSDKEIALLENFAAQAVIAMENVRLITEQREALEQQTATAEVLQVINTSPGSLAPVFAAILEKSTRLCDTAFGVLLTYDGELWRTAAVHGPTALAEFFMNRPPWRPAPGSGIGRHIVGEDVVHSTDLGATDLYAQEKDPGRSAYVELGQARTAMSVALRKDDILLGAIQVYRQEVRSFDEREIALLQSFAAQAVIAMENARLLTEQREALDQQTATAEVLQVINASPGDLVPVFDTILEKAHRLCGAALGSIVTFDGEYFRAEVTRGYPEEYEALMRQGFRGRPQSAQQALVDGERFIHVTDWQIAGPWRDDEVANAFIEATGVRTFLVVPLSKDGSLLGFIGAHRQEVRAFTDKEISLLENFAAQAVIAMENARLLADIRQRQEELRITFENMGDGVAMFDETPRLVAWNSKFQELLEVPEEILNEQQTYTDYIRYLTERGEYGPDADTEIQVHRFQERMREHYSFERTRPDGRVIEVRHNPVPEGGFVLIYTDITERKRNEAEIRAARDAAETALRGLRTAQANLIQAEKMASLGQLTAGIAHEIKNPLNFVNNFAELSGDLLDELNDAVAGNRQDEIDELRATLQGNLAKITEHGRRADAIVRSMLEHSRGSSGERRVVELNALIDEALNLAYHGARAQDQSFNITLERDFGVGIAPIEVNPQDITRVFLNIFSNGFYAATRRAREGGDAGFVPTLKVTTIDAGEAVEIRVRDNGTGIPADIRDKLFQPFFTTKPTGEGTGLGLSITYDIVTQQHGGHIAVDSKAGDYSEFTIRLPRKP